MQVVVVLFCPDLCLTLGLDELGGDPTRSPVRRTLVSSKNWTPSSRAMSFARLEVFLYCKADVRAMTLSRDG